MLAGKSTLRRHSRRRVTPDNLVPHVLSSEDRIQQQPNVTVGVHIDVNVNAPARFQDAGNLQNPGRKHAQVAEHRTAVCMKRGLAYCVNRRVSVRNFANPAVVKVTPRPRVLEGGSGGFTADGRFVKAIAVERRISVNQVDTRVIQPAQNGQVIADEDGAVGYHVRAIWRPCRSHQAMRYLPAITCSHTGARARITAAYWVSSGTSVTLRT